MKPPIYDPSWSAEEKALYRHDMEEIWDPRITPHIWNLYHSQLEMYQALVGEAPKDVLDIGCAQGTLALTLAEAGHRVKAVDIRSQFLKYAQSRYTHGDVEFICGNALEIELEPQFDVVFANQILEHLVYPVEFTVKMAQFLRRGGQLVMTTPSGEYLKNSLPSFRELGDPKHWEHMQYTADGDGHFFAYTAEELLEIAVAAGLRNVEVVRFESPWISGHMKVRYLHGRLPVRFLRCMDRMALRLPWLGKRFSYQLMLKATRVD